MNDFIDVTMNDVIDTSGVKEEDAAWAAINTPLSVEDLILFCQDIERLFRINPMLEFSEWAKLSDTQYRMAARNISQEVPFEIDTEINVEQTTNEIVLNYSKGIKSKTVFIIEPSEYGSKLTITDYYDNLSEKQRQSKIQEVDKSIVNWADYLQRFLITWNKWSKFSLWRWYMKRIWQPMKPTGRRVTYMLLWITLVEIALITLGVGIYLSEFR